MARGPRSTHNYLRFLGQEIVKINTKFDVLTDWLYEYTKKDSSLLELMTSLPSWCMIPPPEEEDDIDVGGDIIGVGPEADAVNGSSTSDGPTAENTPNTSDSATGNDYDSFGNNNENVPCGNQCTNGSEHEQQKLEAHGELAYSGSDLTEGLGGNGQKNHDEGENKSSYSGSGPESFLGPEYSDDKKDIKTFDEAMFDSKDVASISIPIGVKKEQSADESGQEVVADKTTAQLALMRPCYVKLIRISDNNMNHNQSGTSSRNSTFHQKTSSKKAKNKKRNHVKTLSMKKDQKCKICSKCFCSKSALITHNRIHTGEKPFKCNVCQQSFNQKSNLTDHARIHTGKKPFQCHVCQQRFNQKSNLTIHARIHTGEKLFQCNVCQQLFGQKSHLTDHARIHTGEKPFQCNVCQKRFRQKSNSTRHARLHTGEKPFESNLLKFPMQGRILIV